MKYKTEKGQIMVVTPLFGHDDPLPYKGKSWSDVMVGDYYLYAESPFETCRKLSDSTYEFWDKNGIYVGERYALITVGNHFFVGGNDENH